MRKLILMLIAITTIFCGCKKYEEGPCISFRSPEKRLYGGRTLTKYTVDGVDSISLFNIKLGPNFMFYRNEVDSHNYLIIYRTSQSDTNGAIGCYWQFSLDKKNIKIFPFSSKRGIAPLKHGIDSNWEILRLTKKDLYMKTTYNGKEYLIELKD